MTSEPTPKDVILTIPNPVLRKKSKPVKKITPDIEKLAELMIEVMDEHSGQKLRVVGLSACQLGASIRMMAFYTNPNMLRRDAIQIVINPELVYAKKSYIARETCLSIPGKTYRVKRFKMVKIRGLTLNGETHSFRGRALLAQIFSHELDHIDGILIDKSGELEVR